MDGIEKMKVLVNCLNELDEISNEMKELKCKLFELYKGQFEETTKELLESRSESISRCIEHIKNISRSFNNTGDDVIFTDPDTGIQKRFKQVKYEGKVLLIEIK